MNKDEKSKVGIAIIGLDHWYWALGCAYGIALNPNADLTAIADSKKKEAEQIGKIYGARTSYTDYHDVLNNPEVDGVVITTTTNLHAKIAQEAAEAGKHILIGKPIARSLHEADMIIETAKNAGVKLLPMAAGPLAGDYVLELINDGKIGKPFAAHSSMLAIPPLRAPGINEPGWFVDPLKTAGGGFIDHAVYDIALLRKYFKSEVDTIYAEMGKFKHKDYNVEDHGIAIVRFRDRSIATVEASFTSATESHGRKIIIGTEGEIETRPGSVSIWSTRESGGQRVTIETMPSNAVFARNYVEKPIPSPPFAEGYRPTVDEFIDCISKNRNPSLTGYDARAVLEACLAAYKSTETGAPVKLPLKSDVDVPHIVKSLR